jgi:GTP-binding protein HflX
MNFLSKSDVFAENKLFATLDTTVRKVVIHNVRFLWSDTVGFIRKLPHMLVESFKSTLDEVREADLLLHVVDISHPNFEEHYRVVNETLAELKSNDKPTIVVFNKIDALKFAPVIQVELEDSHPTLEDLKTMWMSKLEDNCVFVSAQKKENVEELKAKLYESVKTIFQIRYPYNNYLFDLE